ncbi:hypothetical protein [Rhizobium sp.]
MSSVAAGRANTRETLAAVLRTLRIRDLPCELFGGWAEELLGLREPWQHGDIDLVFRGDSLAAFDALGDEFAPVPAKRFHHKRAFTFSDVLCEVILVQGSEHHPVTHFWGDTPFHWHTPLLHSQAIDVAGERVGVISVENLLRYRHLHRERQPDRWHDPQSLVP